MEGVEGGRRAVLGDGGPAILVVASTLGLRAGGLMLVAGNQELSDAEPARDDQHVRMLAGTAVTGLRRLIARDRA
jgi:hypothetical protein